MILFDLPVRRARHSRLLRTGALAVSVLAVLAGAACGSGTGAPPATTTAAGSPSSTAGTGTAPTTSNPTTTAGRTTTGGTDRATPAPRWSLLPPSPLPSLSLFTGVWTGTELIVVGEHLDGVQPQTGHAAAYNLGTRTWRKLPAPSGKRVPVEGAPQAVWTGREMIVLGGDFQEAYDPATNRWRHLVVPGLPEGTSFGGGFAMVWTGRVVLTYGGGCCGSADGGGTLFDPVTNSWSRLGSQALGARWTSGAWTGTEVVIAGGNGPVGPETVDGHLVDNNVDLNTAAAYDPVTRVWRKLPTMPAAVQGPVVWNGSQVIVLGHGGAVAYSPATGRWTTLPAGFDRRVEFGVVRAGDRLLVWGGRLWSEKGGNTTPPSGLIYTPGRGWSRLPVSPLRGRSRPLTVWTGQQLLVWGGWPDNAPPLADGAALSLW